MASNPVQRFTEEQYLELERVAETKSEFLGGEIFAMPGGTAKHSLLQGALVFEFMNRLGDRPCFVFPADMRIKVSPTGLYTYPDVSVVCGKPVFRDATQDNLLNPTVIVEVLSPSTELYDRSKKFQHYSTLESLKDYILVSQDSVLVEHYTRKGGEAWTLFVHSKPESELRIDSIEVAIPLRDIYRKIELLTA